MSHVNFDVDGNGRSALITITASERGQTVRIHARMDQDSLRRLIRKLCDRAGLPEPWKEETR